MVSKEKSKVGVGEFLMFNWVWGMGSYFGFVCRGIKCRIEKGLEN